MTRNEVQLYVVKVKRHYGQHEADSVVFGPRGSEEAEARLQILVGAYQDPDAYYIEQWRQS